MTSRGTGADGMPRARMLLSMMLLWGCTVLPVTVAAAQRPTPRQLPLPGRTPPPAPADPAATTAVTGTVRSVAGCSPSVKAWWRAVAGTGQYGRIVCATDPTRPAILLFHGLHQDARTWTAPSFTEYAYDYTQHPSGKRIGDIHRAPNTGVYKIGKSDWLYGNDRIAWDQEHNWFDYLVKQGFTVATWSQPGLRLEEARQSALDAFDSLLAQTAARSPTAPPPVALIGQSRGGLLIRQVLKEKGSMGRVKWVVTLHSPHAGSEIGRTPGKLAAEIVDLIDCCAPPALTGPIKAQLKDMAVEAMRPMTKLLMDDESRELSPGSPLLRNLADGEKKLEDVTYYTFGGTNPRVYRLYTWIFDGMSATPQYSSKHGQYFVWHVKPVEIASISPILDKIRDFAPEVVPGKGDALVADESSRLPWSIHTTSSLNHAELLWNQPLMRKVAGIFGPSVAATRLPAVR
jgi:hypothetical protein